MVTKFENLTTCYYEGFRSPSTGDPKYKKTIIYWEIQGMRVIFIVIYQNLVASARFLVQWLIPKVPEEIKKEAKWGENLVSTIIMNQGLEMVELDNNN